MERRVVTVPNDCMLEISIDGIGAFITVDILREGNTVQTEIYDDINGTVLDSNSFDLE